jgi:anhydro-N-acetylmuramic acid kinase
MPSRSISALTQTMAPAHPPYFIGLMSGTSMDGIDAVLTQFDSPADPTVLHHVHQPFDAPFRAELLALNAPSHNELHRSAIAANGIAQRYASAVHRLLDDVGLSHGDIAALGAHGQTVRHQPTDALAGYTVQLINGALLAELTGICTVTDFRSRDVAAGGQGAPLVPAFHAALFAQADQAVSVLNLGGIANLTWIGPHPLSPRTFSPAGSGTPSSSPTVLGFDCGPANVLLDGWIQRHTGDPWDASGAWASAGSIQPALLAALLAEPYFSRLPPKSTGRDLFTLGWVERCLAACGVFCPPSDVQATLAELTAITCSHALTLTPGSATLLICGGGAYNRHLLGRLQHHLPQTRVGTTDEAGLPPTQVEGAAFAWLARERLANRPGSLPAVTGAQAPRVLGAIHSA